MRIGGLSRWVVLGAIVAVPLAPQTASACGYFEFGPHADSAEDPGAVLAHRVAIAVHGDELIYWDQIVYRGEPADFVWVLPVPAGALVEVGDNAFFEALTLASRVNVRTSVLTCTGDTSTVSEDVTYGEGSYARPPTLAPDDAEDLYVSPERVVGPYETVTIDGDVDQMLAWLIGHDYRVSEAAERALRSYAPTGGFAVMRLAPGAGVDRMAPVRVRVGADFEIPLRLLAAGSLESVDLELFVLSDGARFGVTGFENAEVDRSRLAYDAALRRFNYRELFELAVHPYGAQSPGWVTEFAGPMDVARVRGYRSVGLGEADMRSAAIDVDAATAGFDAPYVTRIRTRLAPAELDRDLGVVELVSAENLLGDVAVDRVLNNPGCPDAGPLRGVHGFGVCDDGAICISRECGCSARAPSSRGVWGAALLVAALVVRRRR